MKTPTSFILTSILGSLLMASCQSNSTAEIKPPPNPVPKVKPAPSWTKLVGKKETRKNSRKVKISSKLIEIVREPEDANLPAGLSQKTFSDAAFQGYLRELAQTKGTDIMTAPTVVSHEGQTASVAVTREFVYPNPENPDKSVTEETGVSQFFRARSYDGGKTYRLNIFSEVKEFIGFEKSPNGSEQPIFRTRQVGDTVTLARGETIVFSGLVTDQEQKVEDRVPIIGDIPLVGRIFRKNETLILKSELILAVTAEEAR